MACESKPVELTPPQNTNAVIDKDSADDPAAKPTPTTVIRDGVTTIYTNQKVAVVAPLQGAASYLWQQTSGTSEVVFSKHDGFQTDVSTTADDAMEFQVSMTFAGTEGGGDTIEVAVFKLIWDTAPPEFLGMTLANEAADALITESEILSSLSIGEAQGWGHKSIYYSNFIDAAVDVSCDQTKNYPRNEAPLVSDLPPVNGPYQVCIQLADEAGNVLYGQSPLILRNVKSLSGPVLNSLTLANQAADGYINAAEAAQSLPMAVLDASNFASVSFTAILPDNNLICDWNQKYVNNAIPPIHAIPPADGAYAVCVRLKDADGYTVYGKSEVVIRDVTPPLFVSLLGIQGAADGMINGDEASSTANLFALNASGYNNLAYTAILDNGMSVSCGLPQVYDHSDLPTVSSLPNLDGSYALCVRLLDTAGNVSYGKSMTILRDTAAPTAVVATGVPTGTSDTTILNVTVSGTGVSHFKHKVGLASNTDCGLIDGYGTESYVSKTIANNIGTLADDNNVRLCVIGRDMAGNWMPLGSAASHVWYKDVDAPDAPQNLLLTAGNSLLTINYQRGAKNNAGFLMIQSSSPIVWTPTNGQSYAGNIDANTRVLADTNNTTYADTTAINGATYYLKVWSHNSLMQYSSVAIAGAATLLDPQPPIKTSHTVDGEVVTSTTVTLSARGTSINSPIDYEFQLSKDVTFANDVETLIDNRPSGEEASVTFNSLKHASVYYWRVRQTSGGQTSVYTGNTWFKAEQTVTIDTKAQFDEENATYTTTYASTTNEGEVLINSGQVEGYYCTRSLSLVSLGWHAWGAAFWESRSPSSGSGVSGYVQYFSGSDWQNIPSSYLSHSSFAFLIPIAALDPAIHHTIRICLRLVRSNTTNSSPSLRQIKITARDDVLRHLTNGGFDSTVGTEWVIHKVGGAVQPTHTYTATSPSPHSGSYALKLTNATGTPGTAREAWVQQTMQVPVGATNLNYYYQANTKQWGSPVRIFINGDSDVTPNGPLWGIINPGGKSLLVSTWTLRTIPVAAWAGQTITLTIGIYDIGSSAGNTDHAATWSFDSFSFSP